MRYTKTVDWFTMWKNDKDSIIVTMHNNLTADLNCGYNPTGLSIRSQVEMIDNYVKDYSETLDNFKTMTEEEINHWCFYDLLRRGAIE